LTELEASSNSVTKSELDSRHAPVPAKQESREETKGRVTSKQNEAKARREREIFSAFVLAANLDVENDSISSEPPFPEKTDIRCLVEGQCHYFELTEIVDAGLAESDSLTQRDGRSRGGFYSSDIPLIKAFRDKAEKSYDTTDGRLELLAYYNKQEYDPYPLAPSMKEELYSITNRMLRARWYRLWLYDYRSNRICLRFPHRHVTNNRQRSTCDLHIGSIGFVISRSSKDRIWIGG
jgi:hypothetical protein